ncbi:MAG: hypothetical protein O7E51_05795 [Acidobacteria bacterium]|nr:hypothetical protein [Acidobacteriota bacterium]
MNRRVFVLSLLFCSAGLLTAPPSLISQEVDSRVQLSREQQEEFLRTAEIIRIWELSEGITNSHRATLTDGQLTHDAHIQMIDISRKEFKTLQGTELNFRDTYKHNIAAYLLDKALDLGMIPVSVERKVKGRTAALTWWVDDVLMTEKERMRRKIESPDAEQWNRQIYCVRVFDQLIYNTDRNLGNLVITKDWTVWMIDHTRAFRLYKTLRNPKNLVKIDRRLLAALRELTYETLATELQQHLKEWEMEALLARRDRIVEFFEKEIAEKGEKTVLYDYLSRR